MARRFTNKMAGCIWSAIKKEKIASNHYGWFYKMVGTAFYDGENLSEYKLKHNACLRNLINCISAIKNNEFELAENFLNLAWNYFEG